MDARKDCRETGYKLPVDQARSRVIRSSILEVVRSLDATPDELLNELVWIESNAESLPKSCPQCGRLYQQERHQRAGCTLACRRLLMQEKKMDTVKSGN